MSNLSDFYRNLKIFGIERGAGGGDMLSANNLSDVASISTSRVNLQVPRTTEFTGDPNGNVAGIVGDFVIDPVAENVYTCTTAGTTVTAQWALIATQGGALLAANNLSDVVDAQTSRVNLSVSKSSSGIGSPQGTIAGTISDTYIDTATNKFYVCVFTGSSSTAVWETQGDNIESIYIDVTTPTQLSVNTLYAARIASPSPAIGIMPISPKFGDILIIYSIATQGIQVNIGTATEINLVGSSVLSSFFVPFRGSIVLRCVSSAGGGHWQSESICSSVLIDGSTTQNAIGNIQLNKSSNLSDVVDPVVSLSNIGGQPINIVGTGNPNGSQAGTAGINLYYDSASQQYWNCTTTGTSLTAIWTSSRDIFPVNYIDLIAPPVQLQANNIYLARVASPSPANAIMPVSPNLGDLLIIYATGAEGVNIAIGTAISIRISTTSVFSSFFMPVNSSIVLRCVVDSGGGQWRAESIVGNLTIDGTTTQNSIDNVQQPLNLTGSVDPNGNVAGTAGINFYFNTVTLQMWRCISTGNSATAIWTPITQESNILPANTIYFSDSIGSDTLGNGSESFPFATYNFAATYAAGLAESTNKYAVFPMGNEIVTGDIVIYPFVGFAGSNPDANSLSTTGSMVVDSSWGTTPNSTFYSKAVGLDIQSGVNIVLPAPQGAQFFFVNSPFSNATPSITAVGTDSTSMELMVFINEVSIITRPDITVTNFITAIDDSSSSNITSINNSANKQSILVFLGNSLLTSSGTTTIQTVAPGQASLLLSTATLINTLVLDGATSICELDSVSYPASISFLNGATFSNVNLVTLSEGISTATFTPVGYSRPVSPPLWVENCATNDFSGISNELVTIKTPSVVQADRHGAAQPILVTGFLICTDVREDTNGLYNNVTGTFTADKDGIYEFNYEVHTSGTGTSVPLNTVYYIDTAFYKNGTFLDVQYSSNRNSGVLNGVVISTDNHGHAFISLVVGDTIKVNVVQNGNIPLTLLGANFSAKYIRA